MMKGVVSDDAAGLVARVQGLSDPTGRRRIVLLVAYLLASARAWGRDLDRVVLYRMPSSARRCSRRRPNIHGDRPLSRHRRVGGRRAAGLIS